MQERKRLLLVKKNLSPGNGGRREKTRLGAPAEEKTRAVLFQSMENLLQFGVGCPVCWFVYTPASQALHESPPATPYEFLNFPEKDAWSVASSSKSSLCCERSSYLFRKEEEFLKEPPVNRRASSRQNSSHTPQEYPREAESLKRSVETPSSPPTTPALSRTDGPTGRARLLTRREARTTDQNNNRPTPPPDE